MPRLTQHVYEDRTDVGSFDKEKLLRLWREGGAVIGYGEKLHVEIEEYVKIPDETNPVTAALTAIYVEHIVRGDALIELLLEYRDVLAYENRNLKQKLEASEGAVQEALAQVRARARELA